MIKMGKDVFPKQFFCDLCSSCECSAVFTGLDKKGAESEMICGGLIKKTRKPKDDHERMNRIRFCTVVDGHNPSKGVNTNNLTEMEAAELIRILSSCLGDSLKRLQPIKARVESP